MLVKLRMCSRKRILFRLRRCTRESKRFGVSLRPTVLSRLDGGLLQIQSYRCLYFFIPKLSVTDRFLLALHQTCQALPWDPQKEVVKYTRETGRVMKSFIDFIIDHLLLDSRYSRLLSDRESFPWVQSRLQKTPVVRRTSPVDDFFGG